MVTAWETIDDPRALGAALDDISSLTELLERERAAVAALDPAKLTELAELKHPLMERLQQLAQTPPRRGSGPRASRELRQNVRTAVEGLMAQAEANAALLNDAIHALSAALGIEQEAGTYDAHARMRRRVRVLAGSSA